MNYGTDVGQVEGRGVGLGKMDRPTLTQQLSERKQYLEDELSQVNALIRLLEKNPMVLEVLDQMTKINMHL